MVGNFHTDPDEKETEGKPKPFVPTWDHEKDNCGIDPEENPCGDANEY